MVNAIGSTIQYNLYYTYDDFCVTKINYLMNNAQDYRVLYGNNKKADIVFCVHDCSPVNMGRFFSLKLGKQLHNLTISLRRKACVTNIDFSSFYDLFFWNLEMFRHCSICFLFFILSQVTRTHCIFIFMMLNVILLWLF